MSGKCNNNKRRTQVVTSAKKSQVFDELHTSFSENPTDRCLPISTASDGFQHLHPNYPDPDGPLEPLSDAVIHSLTKRVVGHMLSLIHI